MSAREVNASALVRRFLDALTPPARAAISAIVAAGGSGGVYVAGGAVRDLLLGRPIVDVDLVAESDALDVVRRALPDARITTHDRFHTAALAVDGTRIDFATARRESYAAPGALPDVETAAIEEDLRRRDFSINAMALRLGDAPELLDPAGGVSDLDARLVRVLHDGSFRDDATRIFRALRYAARLGFETERHTADLMRRDLRYIDAIGGERLRREVELMLLEPTGGAALEAAASAEVLRAAHPSLAWDRRRSDALRSPPDDASLAAYGFALLAADASPEEAAATIGRLKLNRDESQAVAGIAAMHTLAPVLRRTDAKPSGVAVVLDRVPPAAIAAFGATAGDPIAGQVALRYLAEWRRVKPILRGTEIIEMGVPVGPQVQRALQLVRAARLDGWARDRGDEQALVLRFAKSIRDSTSETAGGAADDVR